jgi:hypothetical protein
VRCRPGPLGANVSSSPLLWQRHDLEHMLLGARRLGVPMIVGSAGDTGSNSHSATRAQPENPETMHTHFFNSAGPVFMASGPAFGASRDDVPAVPTST